MGKVLVASHMAEEGYGENLLVLWAGGLCGREEVGFFVLVFLGGFWTTGLIISVA